MSWLARSIATSLRLDDNDDDNNNHISDDFADKIAAGETDSDQTDDDEQRGGGMKEDFSELKQTLTRQIWGVASFLAPPPPPPPLPNLRQRPDLSAGDRSLEASGEEIEVDSAKCRSGGYRDLAQMLPYRLEDQIGGAVGITEESLAFASNIAHHPETWLDFPLFEEEEEINGNFYVSTHIWRILLLSIMIS